MNNMILEDEAKSKEEKNKNITKLKKSNELEKDNESKKFEKIKKSNELEETNETKKTKSKKKFRLTIFDYSILRICAYFIAYSFGGFLAETVFAIITKGVLESRQSMLYGPFCCIYGVGAIFLICIPKNLKKNKKRLFIAGFVIGSVIEYVISWVCDYFFHMKWWDYSNLAFNINGRICLIYSVFWGFLAIVLNRVVNPKVDKLIDKIPTKILRILVIIIGIYMVVDEGITSYAWRMFFTKIEYNYKLDLQGTDSYYEEYLNKYLNDEKVKNNVDKYFSYDKMLKTFPNVKLTLKNGDIIWARDLLKDIQPYYIKLFEVKQFKHFELLTD